MLPYKALDNAANEIRLLRLKPGSSHNEPIKCQFTVASLNEGPQYEAISYVWGKMTSDHTVDVDGVAFNVTANVDLLLRHLRFAKEERLIWVDALCINQSNIQERQDQVSRMKYIYGRASHVIIWLGEGWPGSEVAMDFLRQLGRDVGLHHSPKLEPCVRVNGLDLDSQTLRGRIFRLFRLPWWSRTWTVHEFVLAKRLVFQCSTNFMTQQEMFSAVHNFWHHRNQCCQRKELNTSHPEFRGTILSAFYIPSDLDFVTKEFNEGPAYSLLSAIVSFSNRGATDPRDKVYGMLGLGTGPYADLVEPDYSLTPEQVSLAVVLRSIERPGTLECFSHVFGDRKSNLPSFIPNWTGKFGNNHQITWLGSLKLFSASLKLPAQVRLINANKLAVVGTFVDKIELVSEAGLAPKLSREGGWTKLHSLAEIWSQPDTPYRPTGESRLLALWHTVNTGKEMYFEDTNRFFRRLQVSAAISNYQKYKDHCDAAPGQKNKLRCADINHMSSDVTKGCHKRRFAVTRKGYFAMVPQSCQPGDWIVVLLGGSVPYVLRPTNPRGPLKQNYRIMGDAYVHGIMNGEALQPEDTMKQRLKEIILV